MSDEFLKSIKTGEKSSDDKKIILEARKTNDDKFLGLLTYERKDSKEEKTKEKED